MKLSLFYSLFIIIIFTILSCKKSNCPNDLDLPYQELIKDFHSIYFKEKNIQFTEQHFSIYLDYSGSMKIAFDDNSTEKFYNLFINSLKISKVDFYEVNNDNINLIEKLEKSDLYKKIKATEKFNGKNAPLNEAMKKIVSNNSESVFITDGELWENQERDDPWAREEFAEWLKNGNSIDFFVTDHKDSGKDKHVFYMFFIPLNNVNNKDNISNQFKFYLENSIEAKNLEYSYFSFSNKTFKLIQEYKTATSGGINENAGQDETTYVNEGKIMFYEYMDLMTGWKDIVKYIFNAYDNNGNPVQGGDPLLSKLYIETNGLEFYTIEELGIKVYNIKPELDKFKKIKEAKKNKPSFLLDEKGQIMLDQENKPIIECPGQFECFNEQGDLIIDTNYLANLNIIQIKEIYDFDNDSFMNNFKNQGRGEIVIKIHKNFDESQLSSETENMHRIDIYLKKVTPKTNNPNLNKFIWQGKQVERNASIYNSILGALNDANPESRVIYTYYIKSLPFKR